MKLKPHTLLCLLCLPALGMQAQVQFPTKPATAFTQTANNAVLQRLPFNDRSDFDDVRKGWIAPLLNNGIVLDSKGETVYDARMYRFPENQPAPASVNPALWRQCQLNAFTGLFKVCEGVYQVRGLDISNITFIESDNGIIVVDPLISAETAADALKLYRQNRTNKPVVAVIYTHSHTDHCNGVRGVVDEADVKAGKVKIIAPTGFTEELVSEDIYAGTAMLRRATYSYSAVIGAGERGNIGTGLGPGASHGTVTLILPTDLITQPQQNMTVDGVELQFLLTPNTEAPAEMHFYVPRYKALCTAENACHTLHNFYTLRGAKTRNVYAWVKALNQTLELWGDKAEALFMPHTWPVWTNTGINKHIEDYRDALKYIHDQTLHLANQGYTMDDIGYMVQLPPQLDNVWSNQGFYGSVSHNARAVYNYYLGFFNGNPADLNRRKPLERAALYVQALGGEASVMAKASEAMQKGDYQWAAELLNHVVMNNPSNGNAKSLEADALEQMGYQAESATWRGFYLSGAYELRNGVNATKIPNTASPDMLSSLTPTMMMDYMAIRLNGQKAAAANIGINLNFTDLSQQYGLTVKKGVMNYRSTPVANADLSIKLTLAQFQGLVAGAVTIDALVKDKKIEVTGNTARFNEMLQLMDNFKFWFNIVTPN
ncbi:MAG: MBL fold metallo-hydrolase [Flavobacterium sp. JAD_PAG50586_2]|nr:MAG: MBL fold metallo-hydrolase [Flavobacterium sp. JAD_PAG50586_2]